MCTLAALVPPGDSGLPVVVAANRDEMLDRPALPFGRHWPGKPWRAGRDELAGGTWAGLHDDGYGVFVLNRERSLGPQPGKRSRGLLALDLLDAGSAEAAAEHALALPAGEYRPFHAVIASAAGVTGVSGGGSDAARATVAAPGVTLWTAAGANSDASGRQVAHRGAFRAAWETWCASRDTDALFAVLERLLAAPAPRGGNPHDAMCIRAEERGFGTRSSLVASFGGAGIARIRVADDAPDRTAFRDA
jgi:hypothetical protein